MSFRWGSLVTRGGFSTEYKVLEFIREDYYDVLFAVQTTCPAEYCSEIKYVSVIGSTEPIFSISVSPI
jgi:hypothetical protein